MTTILKEEFRVVTHQAGDHLNEMFTIKAKDREHCLWIAARCLPGREVLAAFQVVEVIE